MKKIISLLVFGLMLQSPIYSSLPNPFSADISFCIVDLKYNGNTVKICEFGDCMQSMFAGYDKLYEKGALWRSFWKFLHRFDLPIWFVGPKPHRERCVEMSLLTFPKFGGRFVEKITKLEEQKQFEKNPKKRKTFTQNIRQSLGIVIPKNGFSPTYLVEHIKNKYPSLIFLDRITKEHVSNKYNTHQLFQDPELAPFRPQCKAYPKIYTDILAGTIRKDIQSDIYVIKPINAAKGQGVIIVDKKDLNKTLKTILSADSMPSHLAHDVSYSHWKKDKNDIFLVEEFVPSKPLVVDDKTYNPTMRVVFVLYNDNGLAQVNFLGAYWKLPGKSLEESGSLTELHKSHIASRRTSSAKVSPQDFEHVQQILEPVLCKAYVRMLEAAYANF